jgi:c-di-GMP-related signal transduction protein
MHLLSRKGSFHEIAVDADSRYWGGDRMALFLFKGSANSSDPPVSDYPAGNQQASHPQTKHASPVSPRSATAIETLRFVARQPILDRSGRVHGYELLFRSGRGSAAFDGDGDSATRSVLDDSLMFGMERMTGGLPMFVNCTRESLLDRLVHVMPPEHTVLELLETLEPDDALIEACRELKSQGYRIALDDFTWSETWQPLVDLADYVKIDLSTTSESSRTELRERLGQRPIQLILERVETQTDLTQALREGFHLFQGYYFCRPQIIEHQTVPPNRLIHLQIMQAVLQNPLPIKLVSSLVKREPSLTYRLLRMVNSPIYATHQVITSIEAALVMIGDEMFRRVALLATASELRGNHPSELLKMAFLRGRFCELAAPMKGYDPTEQYLLGLLSLLPAMLNVPMEAVATALPLRRGVRQALLGDSNDERVILDWLEHYEMGQWHLCDAIAETAELEENELTAFHLQAMEWAEANMRFAAE